MPRKKVRPTRTSATRTRRAVVPPEVPVRSPNSSKPNKAGNQSSKPKAEADTVDDSIRRMIEAAYT